MAIFVLGINHRSAPVAIREQIAFTTAQLPAALTEVRRIEGVDEATVVSTCNRTEIYFAGAADAPARVQRWLTDERAISNEASDCVYTLADDAATEHAFSVACGLDSMVLGEHQILGQLKEAFRVAQDASAAGPRLNRMFQQAFAVAKNVRTNTGIGASAVSIAYAAVSLARHVFAGFEKHSALLIGAGETTELVARHLHSKGIGQMIIANRSLARAQKLAPRFDAFAISLDEMPKHLDEVDIVISATDSDTPILTHAMLEAALNERRRRPMFLVDLAVPRDIEPSVGNLRDIYLYSVDDLEKVIEENLKSRHEAAQQAREIVAAEAARFGVEQRQLDAVPVIREVRDEISIIKGESLDRARRMLAAGREPDDVLEFLADSLTQRILHTPSDELKQAGERGDNTFLKTARRLFGVAGEKTRKTGSKS